MQHFLTDWVMPAADWISDRSSAKNNYPINEPAPLNVEFVELLMKQGLRIDEWNTKRLDLEF